MLYGNGARLKVWALASLWTAMLNAFFQSGTIPACVTSALVSRIHKKGNHPDTAKHRPIADGEPSYRMYTHTLNERLIHWPGEHGIRSPAQAAFRLKLSTAHHLFALWHFTDQACMRGVPL